MIYLDGKSRLKKLLPWLILSTVRAHLAKVNNVANRRINCSFMYFQDGIKGS